MKLFLEISNMGKEKFQRGENAFTRVAEEHDVDERTVRRWYERGEREWIKALNKKLARGD